MIPWHEGPLVGFDTETTGLSVWDDRIVTAAVVFQENPHTVPLYYDFMIDCGIEIPEAAARVHGISTDTMRNRGLDPYQTLSEINLLLSMFVQEKNAVLVAYNAVYDLTIFREDCIRNYVTMSPALLRAPVIDPLVIDKQTDKYRPGSRRLEDTAKHFGIPADGAHGARADVVMAMRIARKLPVVFPPLAVDAATMHRWQVGWKAQQDADYEKYKRKTDPNFRVVSAWPIEEDRYHDAS